jgi:small subunit ribosomal protein S12
MSTFHQILWNFRLKQYTKKRGSALEQCPQKKGICKKVLVRSPRKPNSAVRKIARVVLTSTLRKIYSYLCGIGHINLGENSTVLVRGGRVRDLPGVLYHVVRGKESFTYLPFRKNARSKYGTKRLA